jgi:hypothetical protein
MAHVIGVVGKPLMSRGVHKIDLAMFRPKVFFHILTITLNFFK